MKARKDNRYNRIRHRIFEIIQIGNVSDLPSTLVDIILAASIIINICSIFLETFDVFEPYLDVFHVAEYVTVIIFTVEYLLRLWTADYLYPNEKYMMGSEAKFIFSITGIIDLCCFLPFYLPFVFPAGIVAFRILRVLRIFRLLRVNAYYDAFNVVTNVINDKRKQLISAVFIILILIMASSLIMYNLEHEAQPEAFKNAFSGIWWSVSTMLTVGYGDIYPVTTAGRLVAIIMAFLGVGLVAIPTGIISAGFVEQWAQIKNSTLDETSSKIAFRSMRRTKKAISPEKMLSLLANERRGVLAVNGDNGYPYAIPVNYYYDSELNKIYFHGSKVGHKIDSIKKNSKVCFTVYGNEFCGDEKWAPFVQSVVIFGRCVLVEDEKLIGRQIRLVAGKYFPSEDEIEAEIARDIQGVQMYQIDIEYMTGKQIQEK